MTATQARLRTERDPADFIGEGRYNRSNGWPPRQRPATPSSRPLTAAQVRRLPHAAQVEHYEVSDEPVATACVRVAMLHNIVFPDDYFEGRDMRAAWCRDMAAYLLFMFSSMRPADIEALVGGNVRRACERWDGTAWDYDWLTALVLAVDKRLEGRWLWT